MINSSEEEVSGLTVIPGRQTGTIFQEKLYFHTWSKKKSEGRHQ